MATFSRATTLRAARTATRRVQRCYSSVAHEEFDTVIVGGGPAGLALANALGASQTLRGSHRVILVEAGDLSKIRDWAMPPDAFSNRVSSITNVSSGFLQETGAWSHVDLSRTEAVQAMEVWDGVSDARISFATSDLGANRAGKEGMARLVENLNVQRALLRNLSSLPHVELADSVKVDAIERQQIEGGGWPLVRLSNGRTLRARLLVGADGINSPVRKFAGIETYGWSYDTHAVVATLRHPVRGPFQMPNTVAYQRFLPTGPIAFLPLSPTVSSLVWSTTPALATALKACEPEVLARMVNAAFRLPYLSVKYLHSRLLDAHSSGAPLSAADVAEEVVFRERAHDIEATSAYSSSVLPDNGGIAPLHADSLPPLVSSIQPGSIAGFPLRYNHADAYIGEGDGARTVLVGDAAHTIHPLAGQGLNLGLADVQALTKCIENAVVYGGDIGSRTALLPYARERYLANHTVMSAVDKLHKLYSTTAAPVVWARSVGLEVVNELDTLKAAFMLSAGARTDVRRTAGSTGWALAAKGVEGAADVLGGARMVGGVLRGLVGAGMQELGNRMSGRRPQ